LKCHYNVKDSITLANDLTKLKIDENHRMITFDIKDLYVNILITETLAITKHLLSEHNEEHITTQILILLETILQQNYSFQNNTYQPKKGVSMGSPISNTVAEIFLQYLENTHLKHILESKHTVFYTRYIDDITDYVQHKICQP
jgi:retron-type reverse transcriptase